jgi:DNA-binding PadR family transcriptional regulator
MLYNDINNNLNNVLTQLNNLIDHDTDNIDELIELYNNLNNHLSKNKLISATIIKILNYLKKDKFVSIYNENKNKLKLHDDMYISINNEDKEDIKKVLDYSQLHNIIISSISIDEIKKNIKNEVILKLINDKKIIVKQYQYCTIIK